MCNPREFWQRFNYKDKNNKLLEVNPDDLYEHLKNAGEQNDKNTNTNIYSNIPKSDVRDNILDSDITEEEVRYAICKLNNGKSPGDDMILNEYIKQSASILVPIYVRVFNTILSTGIYPTSWSLGTIIPIFKNKGDKSEPKNYRPITLASFVGKLFSIV